ncbi:MAG: hypothetical protein M1825_004364 [Sarcosagium campestre]|nr:MAG: hypothetical protein M1825_004364 [Sarcosagium campestre]
MAPPTKIKQWTIQGTGGFDNLRYNDAASLASVGESEVLVRLHAASLNYRDLLMPKGLYSSGVRDGVVPGSDGAGAVEAVGSKVTRFKIGDKVLTLFNQGHQAGSLTPATRATGLGGTVDGTFAQYGIFNENGLVSIPPSLNWLEGSTLTCAGLTAWNALYGLRSLLPGQTVLVQGTGGVSIFALQFALAAGAVVIATTSAEKKVQRLKELGAHHVINYKTDANWGETAKSLTPDKEGVDFVVEVAGPKSMAQSLKAIKIDGIINIIGFVGGQGSDQPGFLDCLSNVCTVRGLLVGSRLQFEEMNRAIEANKIKPVLDSQVFQLEDLKEAYQYQV